MPQPYRQLACAPVHPHTCLDPPRTCQPSASASPQMRLLLDMAIVVIGVLSVGGIAAAAVTSTRGHVEIAPNALTKITKKPPMRTPRATPPPPPTATASQLAWVPAWIGGSHDPKKLLERARALEALGLDMTVIEVSLADPALAVRLDEMWPQTTLPVYDASRHSVEAFELRALPLRSPLRAAGFADGDQVLGIDGYRFDEGTIADIDVLAIQKREHAVVEVVRGTHHVALSLRWHTAHPR
jgi:hypothetical protein